MSENPQSERIVVTSTKSVGLAILLTVLFGPLGMLYSTIPGAIIMIILGGLLIFFTLGIGALIVWPVSILWAALAANSYNKDITSGRRSY